MKMHIQFLMKGIYPMCNSFALSFLTLFFIYLKIFFIFGAIVYCQGAVDELHE